jgi:hypothetical protein
MYDCRAFIIAHINDVVILHAKRSPKTFVNDIALADVAFGLNRIGIILKRVDFRLNSVSVINGQQFLLIEYDRLPAKRQNISAYRLMHMLKRYHCRQGKRYSHPPPPKKNSGVQPFGDSWPKTDYRAKKTKSLSEAARKPPRQTAGRNAMTASMEGNMKAGHDDFGSVRMTEFIGAHSAIHLHHLHVKSYT